MCNFPKGLKYFWYDVQGWWSNTTPLGKEMIRLVGYGLIGLLTGSLIEARNGG